MAVLAATAHVHVERVAEPPVSSKPDGGPENGNDRHGGRRRGAVRAAAVAMAAAAAASLAFDASRDDVPPIAGPPVSALLAPLASVPQDGFTLGRADAPVTATVYAYLGAFDEGFDRALPRLVERYVRPGRVKLKLRTLSGDPAGVAVGSRSAAAAAQAAGLQDRLWAMYRIVNARHVGVLRDADLVAAVEALPGLDRERWSVDARSARVAAAVRRGDARARSAGIEAAPTIVLSAAGRRAVTVPVTGESSVFRALARYDR